ncbi:MAG: type II toxin-antitoxin system VapC family toxin [Arachnia sp.]
MKYLLDTNVLSDARRRSSPRLSRWLAEQRVIDLGISAITLLELELGVRLMERRDARQGAALRRWLQDQVVAAFSGRVLPVDGPVAIQCAGLHVPDRMPDMDALIAATALAHDLTLVTRNTDDMARPGVRLLNPWD